MTFICEAASSLYRSFNDGHNKMSRISRAHSLAAFHVIAQTSTISGCLAGREFNNKTLTLNLLKHLEIEVSNYYLRQKR